MAEAAAEQIEAPKFPKQGSIWKPLPKGKEGKRRAAHAIQTVRASPEQVYNFYARIELLPAWQEGVISVKRLSPTRLHWKMEDPSTGVPVEFESEELEKIPGKRHVSKVTTGPLAGTTEIFTVEPHPSGRGTVATFVTEFVLPGGWFGKAAAAVVSRSPAQILVENLRHLKSILESGEIPRVEGQPAGRRGVSGKAKRFMYGENMPTPPGTTDRARPGDMPKAAQRSGSKWPVVLGSIAAAGAIGALLYIEGKDDGSKLFE